MFSSRSERQKEFAAYRVGLCISKNGDDTGMAMRANSGCFDGFDLLKWAENGSKRPIVVGPQIKEDE
jgi:hypothetical protein